MGVEVIEEEVLLGTLMGRRTKAAGGYNKHIGGVLPTRRGRQDGPLHLGVTPPRHDMHMIMTPRDDDPPPPAQITSCLKHAGTCRVPSKLCEKFATHQNEEVMRYEMFTGQDQLNMHGKSRKLELSPHT